MEKKKYSKNGYLNPTILNNVLQKRPEKPVFGDKGNSKVASLGEIIDVLAEFDSVKINQDKVEVPKKPQVVVKKLSAGTKPSRKFVPSSEGAITKKDHAKVAAKIDSIYIKDGRNLPDNDSKVNAHRSFLETELELANCPSTGPDMKRLRIYSELFEIIIKDFTTYDGLLAEIKNEYDLVIANSCQKEDELVFLRTKVQKLVAKNENRVMLRFERERCKELEERIKVVEGVRLSDR